MSTASSLAAQVRPLPDIPVWQYAAENFNYSRAPEYDTPRMGPFDPDFAPFYKEVMEAVNDPFTKFDYTVKSTRSAMSEHFLTAMRWKKIHKPAPTLFIAADQKGGEEAFDTRVKRGMKLSPELQRLYKSAISNEHVIKYPQMDCMLGWPGGASTLKQTGFDLIVADELSLWKAILVDMLKNRTVTFPFSTIYAGSSLNPMLRAPMDEDPMWDLFLEGDQRYWFMQDPKTGKPFRFRFGDSDSDDGLKWDQGAKDPLTENWDLNRVASTLRYVTPCGTEIDFKDRKKIVATGEWVPTNEHALPGVRSRSVHGMMSPFLSWELIATKYLQAIMKKDPTAMRAVYGEYLAEPFTDDEETSITLDTLTERNLLGYHSGTELLPLLCQKAKTAPDIWGDFDILSKKEKVYIMGGDIQKDREYWMILECIEDGDFGIYGAGQTFGLEEMQELIVQHSCVRMMVDQRYAKRQDELRSFGLAHRWSLCSAFTPASAEKKEEDRKDRTAKFDLPWTASRRCIKTGKPTKRKKNTVLHIGFRNDLFTREALALIAGEGNVGLHLPTDAADELRAHLSGVKMVNGRVEKARSRIDWFDCFKNCVVGARIHEIGGKPVYCRPLNV